MFCVYILSVWVYICEHIHATMHSWDQSTTWKRWLWAPGIMGGQAWQQWPLHYIISPACLCLYLEMCIAVFQIVTLHLRVHVQSSQHNLLKRLFCNVHFLAFFVKNQVTTVSWTYILGLYSISLMCVSGFMPVLCGFFFLFVLEVEGKGLFFFPQFHIT